MDGSGNTHNLAMEDLSSNVLFPCKYSICGCTDSLLYTEIADHEESCHYRPCSCPSQDETCNWQGALEEVVPHLMMSHNPISFLQGENFNIVPANTNMAGPLIWRLIIEGHGYNFILIFKKAERVYGYPEYFVVIQIIGSKKEANNFLIRTSLRANGRQLAFEANPRSIHEDVSTAIRDSDCLVFDTNIAKLFIDSGKLPIDVTISMAV